MPFTEEKVSISRCALAAVTFGLAGIAVILTDVLARDGEWGRLGMPFIAIAALLHVKRYFCAFAGRMETLAAEIRAAVEETDEHWRSAFELGREVGRDESGPRLTPLR